MRTRECTDEKEEELESWDIIEENLLDGIYEDFERAYLLRYAEDWCRENGIVCEETDDYVPVPKREESFEDIVDSGRTLEKLSGLLANRGRMDCGGVSGGDSGPESRRGGPVRD